MPEAAPVDAGARLERIYQGRWTDRERRNKARLWSVLCRSFLQRYVPAAGTVLDLGAGFCDFSNHIQAARRIAIDLNPETRRCAAAGVEVHLVALERLAEVVAPASLDVAFASNVFEHLRGPDALLDLLAAIRQALRPGGRLLVLQPNIRHVGAAFWDFVDHTLPLTEKGMIEALTLSGFTVEECRPRFLPYTIKDRRLTGATLARLYLALPPLQWWFGGQMFLVARRTG